MKVIVYMDTKSGVKETVNKGIEKVNLHKNFLVLKGGNDFERVYMADKLLDYTVHLDNEQE